MMKQGALSHQNSRVCPGLGIRRIYSGSVSENNCEKAIYNMELASRGRDGK